MKTTARLLRRLYSWHPMTIFVAVMASVVMTLITLPGETLNSNWLPEWTDTQEDIEGFLEEAHEFYQAHGIDTERVFFSVHGWPRPAFVRSLDDSGGRFFYSDDVPPGWNHPLNWPLVIEVYRTHWLNLLFDIAVVLAIVLASAAVTEFWIRWRGGLTRYRLADVMIASSAVCAVLGWLNYHQRVAREETRILQRLDQEAPANKRGCKYSPEYVGPDWLQRLVCGEANLPIFHHVKYVVIANEPDVRQGLEQLAKLPYLESLLIDSPLPKTVIRALAEAGTLNTLDYRMDYQQSEPVPGRKIERWLEADDNPELVGPSQLDQLAPLKLKSLLLAGEVLILEDFDRVLASNPQLELLRVGSASVSIEEDREIKKRYPRVEIRSHPYFQPGPNGYEHFLERREAMRQRRLNPKPLR